MHQTTRKYFGSIKTLVILLCASAGQFIAVKEANARAANISDALNRVAADPWWPVSAPFAGRESDSTRFELASLPTHESTLTVDSLVNIRFPKVYFACDEDPRHLEDLNEPEEFSISPACFEAGLDDAPVATDLLLAGLGSDIDEDLVPEQITLFPKPIMLSLPGLSGLVMLGWHRRF